MNPANGEDSEDDILGMNDTESDRDRIGHERG